MTPEAVTLAAAWLPSIAPPPPCTISEFAERAIILGSESNAIAGPLKVHPYQAGMLNAPQEDGAHTIVFMTSAQIGKTLTQTAILGYYAIQEPSSQLFVNPTDSSNSAFTKEKLDPLIAASPILREAFGKSGRANNSDLKLYPGGFVAFASSHQPAQLASRSIRILLVDELDRMAMSAGAEGAPLALALKRTTTYLNRKIVIASTPTSRVQSRIAEQYERSDKRLWHISCPACGVIAPVSFNRLQWPEGEPAAARLACLDCNSNALDERGRLDAIAKGQWIPTATGEPGIIGFHCSQLVSPFVSMESIARESDSAKTPDQRRVFVNTVLGEVYDEGAETDLDVPQLMQKAEEILPPYPAATQFATMGVDVQSNRIEATILAHLPRNQRLVLDHVILNGDPSGDDVWLALDALIGRPLALADKRAIPYAGVAIDAGFNTTRVAQFVAAQRAKSRRVYAIFGRAGFGRPAWKQGAKIARGLVIGHVVGIDDIKLSLQKQLALPRDAPNSVRFSAHLGENWAEQISAERLATTYKKGFARLEFTKAPHARNEALDCLVYAQAVAGTVRQAPPSATEKPAESIAARVGRLNQLSNRQRG